MKFERSKSRRKSMRRGPLFHVDCLEDRRLPAATFVGPSLSGLLNQMAHGKDTSKAVINTMVNALDAQLTSGPLADLQSGAVNGNGFVSEVESLVVSYYQNVDQQLLPRYKNIDMLLKLQGQRMIAQMSSLNQQNTVGLIDNSTFQSQAAAGIDSLVSGPIYSLGTTLSAYVNVTKIFQQSLTDLSNGLNSSTINSTQAAATLDAEAQAYRSAVYAGLYVIHPNISNKMDQAVTGLEFAAAAIQGQDSATALTSLNAAIDTFDQAILDSDGLFGPQGVVAKNANSIGLVPPNLTITRSASTLSNVAASNTFGGIATVVATLTSPKGAVAGREVSFIVDGAFVGSAFTDSTGVASLTGITLSESVGQTGSVFAFFTGDRSFFPSNAQGSLAVNQSATMTSLTSSANPSVSGQPVTFTATVAAVTPGGGTPTGTVNFFDGSTNLGTGTLSATGVATLTLDSLGVTGSPHSITAVYAGNSNYAPSTSTALSQAVNQASTATALTSSANPSVSGQSVTFTATVTATSPGTGTPTGSVNFFDGDTNLGTVALDASGIATLSIGSLSVSGSPHSITAVYTGDTNFATSASTPVSQTVGQAATSTALTSSANPSGVNQPVIFTATVTATTPGGGTPTGTVNFFDGSTSLGSGTLDGTGVATLTVSTLDIAGSPHSITAVYVGDTNFTTSTSPAVSQVVNQTAATNTTVTADANPSVTGQPVTFTATVIPVLTGPVPTGTVNFFDGSTNIGTGTLNGTGVATLTISTLDVAGSPHSITAVYVGDANYSTSTSPAISQTVNQAATSTALVADANPSVSGQPVTFTATVTATAPGAGTPTGSVNFLDGAMIIGTGTLDATGAATFTTDALDIAGSPHSITAVYVGDTGFATSTSTAVSQVVNQASSSTALVSSANPSVSGESVTFTATVTAASPATGIPTGTVNFLDGATVIGTGTLDGTGVATFSTSSLDVAGSPHSITAVYVGDTNFTTSTSPAVSQVVNQASTTTTLTSDTNPSVSGETVTFTATVAATSPGTGTPTGTVNFLDGATVLGTGTLDGTGVATFSTSALDVAGSPHSITAVYVGDTDFATSTSTAVSQAVNQAATSTQLISSANPSVSGESVTFTATVSATTPGTGTPTGTVNFLDGATVIGTGTLDGTGNATFSTSSLDVAGSPHSITAVYVGDTDFTTSTSTAVSQVVNQAATSTALVSSANPSVVGQSVTFTATVTTTAPGTGTATGTVNFLDGATVIGTGTLDGTGVATFSTSSLDIAGSPHSITAVYVGDTNFATSTSTAVSQVVNQAATSTALVSGTNPSVSGESVTFTATVTASAPGAGTPTGTVDFLDGGTVIGVGTLDGSGVATLTTSTLSVSGSPHSITAEYVGDANFTTSTSTAVSQVVNQAATSTALVSSVNPSVSGESVTFTATVTATSPGSGTPTGTVNFLDGATVIGTGTLDGSGVATFTTGALDVAGSPHSITAVYVGDTDFTTSTSTAVSQTVNQAATSTAVESSVNPSVTGQSVTFTATVSTTSPGTGTATGTVNFLDGATVIGTGTLDGSGVATFSTTSLTAGASPHSITAVYVGDTNFATSTSTAVSQVVNAADTTTSLVSSLNPANEGQSVTFTATVAVTAPGGGVATGTVNFLDGATVIGTGTLDGSGVATFSTSSLTALGSPHSITAVYVGNTDYVTSTSTAVSQVIVGA